MAPKIEWTSVSKAENGHGYAYRWARPGGGKYVVNSVYAIIEGKRFGGSNLSEGSFETLAAAHEAAMERVRELGGRFTD